MKRVEEAYSTFLERFPFCFVYWKKYAEARARLGPGRQGANEVFEKSVTAAPFCVHAWQNYCEWHVACAYAFIFVFINFMYAALLCYFFFLLLLLILILKGHNKTIITTEETHW